MKDPLDFLISGAAMREFDSLACARFPDIILMENAGRLMAEELSRLIAGRQEADLIIFAGPGNNGGDALVLARHLHLTGLVPRIYRILPKGKQASSLNEAMALMLKEELCPVQDLTDGIPAGLSEVLAGLEADSVLVDGLLGSGISRPLGAPLVDAEFIEAWNNSKALRVALDVPSGSGFVSKDSSQWAEDYRLLEPVLAADYTLAVQYPRDFLCAPALRSMAGEIRPIRPGFPPSLVKTWEAEPHAHGMIPMLDARPWLSIPALSPHAHKGTRGRLEIYAGSPAMPGAALLASRAAFAAGAGMVRLALEASAEPREAVPEGWQGSLADMLASEPSLLVSGYHRPASWGRAIVAGPGWGRSAARQQQLELILGADCPLVLDADALHLLAGLDRMRLDRLLADRTAPLLLTPHAGEAAAMLGISLEKLEAAPWIHARALAGRFGSWVALKSSVSWISSPLGELAAFRGEEPALGVAGSGDVLAGIIAVLLARGLDPLHALHGAMALHLEAARRAFLSEGWVSASAIIPHLARVASETQIHAEEDEGA